MAYVNALLIRHHEYLLNSQRWKYKKEKQIASYKGKVLRADLTICNIYFFVYFPLFSLKMWKLKNRKYDRLHENNEAERNMIPKIFNVLQTFNEQIRESVTRGLTLEIEHSLIRKYK